MSRCDKTECGLPIKWAQVDYNNKKRPPRRIPLDAFADGSVVRTAGGGNLVDTGETVVGERGGQIMVVRHVDEGEGDLTCHWSTCQVAKPAKAEA